jgi:hypothetical protein
MHKFEEIILEHGADLIVLAFFAGVIIGEAIVEVFIV